MRIVVLADTCPTCHDSAKQIFEKQLPVAAPLLAPAVDCKWLADLGFVGAGAVNLGRRVAVAIAIGLAGFVAFRLVRDVSFYDGWEKARCAHWKATNERAKSYEFDPAKISDPERELFDRSCDFTTFRHLDLPIPAPQQLTWR